MKYSKRYWLKWNSFVPDAEPGESIWTSKKIDGKFAWKYFLDKSYTSHFECDRDYRNLRDAIAFRKERLELIKLFKITFKKDNESPFCWVYMDRVILGNAENWDVMVQVLSGVYENLRRIENED